MAVLFLPGGLLAFAAGVRGWTLAAAAPLLTYGLAGLAGPWYTAWGVAWSPASFATGVVVLCAVTAVARFVLRRSRADPPPLPPWSAYADGGVRVAVALATLIGIVTVVGGMGGIGAIPQDWDAVFHANGIRFIADTGDGSLYGMAQVNWYESGVALYYPNAYHLVAALAYRMSGATVPAVLDAGSALVVGVLALGLAALVRRFGGRPVLAAASALAAAAMTSLIDLLWHGPLLPFAAGVAVVPVTAVLVRDLLDASGVRGRIGPAAVLALALAGLLCLHPAILVSAAVFTLPALVQRWWGTPRRIPSELGALLGTGLVAALLGLQEITGALSTGGNYEKLDRPITVELAPAVGQLLTFSNGADTVQLRLAAVLALGLVGWHALGALRWVAASAALFGVLYVLTAASADPTARVVASLWWNDSWRLVGLAAVPFALLVGQGVALVERWLARLVRGAGLRRAAGLGTAVVALALFVLGTRTLYLERNQQRLAAADTHDGPAVSQLEIAGMQAVARIVPPGSRVLNDRGDGSAWMYALTGLRPVAGHYDDTRIGPDAILLAEAFHQYPNDANVRAAVARLGIRYVQLDRGFLRSWAARQPGLTDLDGQPWLRTVYRNPDVVLYEIVPSATTGTTP